MRAKKKTLPHFPTKSVIHHLSQNLNFFPATTMAEEEYIVDKVLDKRIRNGKVRLLHFS